MGLDTNDTTNLAVTKENSADYPLITTWIRTEVPNKTLVYTIRNGLTGNYLNLVPDQLLFNCVTEVKDSTLQQFYLPDPNYTIIKCMCYAYFIYVLYCCD